MSSSSTTPEAGQQPEPTPSPLSPEQKPCGRTLPHLPHDENSDSHYPCPGVPLSPEEAAEADAIWAERDRRIAVRCHVVLGAHRNVNGRCLYCSKPMTVAAPLKPERLAEIRSTLLGEWLAGGWRVRSVPSPDGGRDQSEVYLPGSAAVIATFPDWADSVAVFLADAHEAVPELLAEVERLTARVAELESIVSNARKLISGWRQSHAEHLQVSLVPTLKANPFMAGQQMGRSNQYSDCAEELADVLLGEDPDDWDHSIAVEVAELEPKGDAEFPPRGGHKNLCAYAAGMSSTCTCDVTAGGAA